MMEAKMASSVGLRLEACAALISAVIVTALCSTAGAADPISEQEAQAIAVDAYVYFYPLVTMDVTRRQATNVESGKVMGRGPANMFTNVPAYPSADFRDVVRPNFDTLYSIAWLDLTKEPMVVAAPDTQEAVRCGAERNQVPLRRDPAVTWAGPSECASRNCQGRPAMAALGA